MKKIVTILSLLSIVCSHSGAEGQIKGQVGDIKCNLAVIKTNKQTQSETNDAVILSNQTAYASSEMPANQIKATSDLGDFYLFFSSEESGGATSMRILFEKQGVVVWGTPSIDGAVRGSGTVENQNILISAIGKCVKL
jgi:hypothetical protein